MFAKKLINLFFYFVYIPVFIYFCDVFFTAIGFRKVYYAYAADLDSVTNVSSNNVSNIISHDIVLAGVSFLAIGAITWSINYFWGSSNSSQNRNDTVNELLPSSRFSEDYLDNISRPVLANNGNLLLDEIALDDASEQRLLEEKFWWIKRDLNRALDRICSEDFSSFLTSNLSKRFRNSILEFQGDLRNVTFQDFKVDLNTFEAYQRITDILIQYSKNPDEASSQKNFRFFTDHALDVQDILLRKIAFQTAPPRQMESQRQPAESLLDSENGFPQIGSDLDSKNVSVDFINLFNKYYEIVWSTIPGKLGLFIGCYIIIKFLKKIILKYE